MKRVRRAFGIAAALLLVIFCGTAQAEGILTLPNDVAVIEEQAFSGDMSLDVVVLPEGVREIGPKAFADSSVAWINLPWTLETIADDAFENTALQGMVVYGESEGYRWAQAQGYPFVLDNDLGAWPQNGDYWVYVPQGETAELAVDYSAAYGDGVRFDWYRYDDAVDGNDAFTWLMNAPSFTTETVNGHLRYVCRVIDIFGDVRDVWFDVMVDNNLRVWPANNGYDWAYAAYGETVTLSVAASAADESVMNCQWYRIGTDEYGNDDWQELVGENAMSLTTDAVTERARYVFRVTDMYDTMADQWFTVDVDPGEDSVSSRAAQIISGTTAWVPLTYSVSETTAANGYRMGVAYGESADELTVNEENRFNSMLWTWSWESGVYGPANQAEFEGWLDELIPGHTYYYCAVITDYEDHVIACEDAIRRLTTGSGAEVRTLAALEEGFAPRGDAKTAFRFTAQTAGVYAVSTDVPADEIIVRATDERELARSEGESSRLSFYASAGETVYVFVRDYSEDVTVRIGFVAEAPTRDAVSTTEATDVTGTGARAGVTLFVTPETAERGYGFGIEYSPYESFFNEYGDYVSSDFLWMYSNRVEAGETYEFETNGMIPGLTYYYRGFIDYNDGSERVKEETVHAVTTEDDWSEVVTLALNEAAAVPLGQETLYRFTAPSTGVYAAVSQGAGYVTLQNSQGLWVTGDYSEDWNDGAYTYRLGFLASEGETIYIVATSNLENVTLSVQPGLTALPVLTLGERTEAPWGRQMMSFTTPEDGWYRFSFESDWYGRMRLISFEDSGWSELEEDETHITRYLTAGTTVYPSAWFDYDRASASYEVTAVNPAESVSVTTLEVTDVTDVSAVFSLEFGIPVLAEGQRYNYGFMLRRAEDESFAGGESWHEVVKDMSLSRWNRTEPYELHRETFSDLPLSPSTTYEYEAFVSVYDEQTDEETYKFGGLKRFTTENLSHAVTQVSVGQTVTAPWREDNAYQLFSFTVPEDAADLYAFTVDGVSVWVIDPEDRVFWPMDSIGGLRSRMLGAGHEGETYTIYMRVWDERGASLTVEPRNAEALEAGVHPGLEYFKLYRFTTPEDGAYLIGATDGALIAAYDSNASGFNHDYSWGWMTDTAEAGETVIFFCATEDGNLEDGQTASVTITPQRVSVSDEAGLREAVSAAAEIAQIRPYFELHIAVDEPLVLSDDLVMSTVVRLELNAPLTIPSGVTLTNTSDILVAPGGSLIVDQGGTLAMQGVEGEWTAVVFLQGGSLAVNGTYAPDENSIIVIDPDNYDGIDDQLAAVSGIEESQIELAVYARNDNDLSRALSLSETFAYLDLILTDGYSPVFSDIAGLPADISAVFVTEGSALEVPRGTEQAIDAAIRLQGGSLTVNGTLDLNGPLVLEGGAFVNNGTFRVNDGGIVNWYLDTYVENTGTLAILSGGIFKLSARDGAITSGEVVNTGTVTVSGGELSENIRFTGGTVDR